MSKHTLLTPITENPAHVDTIHLKFHDNHGDFIHEFMFKRYLTRLQKTIDEKLHTLFGFIVENRDNINIIDDEHHKLDEREAQHYQNLTSEISALKQRCSSLENTVSSLSNRISNLENK